MSSGTQDNKRRLSFPSGSVATILSELVDNQWQTRANESPVPDKYSASWNPVGLISGVQIPLLFMDACIFN